MTKKRYDHIVGRHFNEPGHNGIEDMKIHVVDFVHAAPESQGAAYLRDRIELNWIYRLKKSTPWGLNMLD